ncbi:hypothetical protein DB346_18865 [Verrucomicrobia bacterium LW23]|nr:hypothetical protein DB346_18865 [Verrucomicrobia bacterium LW23]
MAYQVFARKYRPRTFAEVVGQEHITRTLENAIRLGRIAQTYLFVGPRGTGKTSTARILAKALNCSNGPKIDFDLNDEVCVEIAEGRSLDVLEIDGASNNGVEQVRDLRDNVRYAPVRGRYKIYIIDEVHMLTGAAFNALLKTLEEPPPHVKFIFATTEVHKLPATILSRCQRFDLRRIPDTAIAAHLGKICKNEGVEAEPGALSAIARYAEGGLRDAESALDQVIGFYGDRVTEADVLAQFGLSGFGPVAELADCVVNGDVVQALTQTRAFVRGGKDLGRLSQDLLRFFRNLIVYQIAPETLAGELPQPELDALASCAAKISRPGATAVLEELGTLESRLRYALSKDVLFEVTMIQLCTLREKVSLESILLKLGSDKDTPPRPGYAARAASTGTRALAGAPGDVSGGEPVATPAAAAVRSTYVAAVPESSVPLAAGPSRLEEAVSAPAPTTATAPVPAPLRASAVPGDTATEASPDRAADAVAAGKVEAPATPSTPAVAAPALATPALAAAAPNTEATPPSGKPDVLLSATELPQSTEAQHASAPDAGPDLFGDAPASPTPPAPVAVSVAPEPAPNVTAAPAAITPAPEEVALALPGTAPLVEVSAPAAQAVPATQTAAPVDAPMPSGAGPEVGVSHAIAESETAAPVTSVIPSTPDTPANASPIPEIAPAAAAPRSAPAPAAETARETAPSPAKQKYIPASLGVVPQTPAPSASISSGPALSAAPGGAGDEEEMSPFASPGEDAPPVAAGSAEPPKGAGRGRGKSASPAARAAADRAAANAGRRIENAPAVWAAVADTFAAARPTEAAMIGSMRVEDVRGAELYIKVPTKFGSKLNWLRHKKNLEIIETAFQEEIGFIPLITFILGNVEERPTAAAEEDGPAGKLDSASFENDPLIRQALELFEARIVSPRK